MKVSVEKPGTPGELAHHGVKGMKWGVRRESGASISRRAKADFNKKNLSSRDKAVEIRRARAQSNLDFTNYADAKGKERKALKQVYLRSPDRATALRTTRGEKVVLSLLAGTGVFTAPIAVGSVGRMAFRRHVERKQARGGYK